MTRRRLLGGLGALAGAALLGPLDAIAGESGATLPAAAPAGARGERVLSLVHTHTGERLTVPYWGDGTYLPGGLLRLEDFLRDFRTEERHPVDPALLDQLHALRLATGSREPFQVVSGYRSAATNASLRAARGGQARHSLHMEGRAVDVRLPDVRTSTLRDAALELRRGGVGYYAASDFVHVDTGPVRRW